MQPATPSSSTLDPNSTMMNSRKSMAASAPTFVATNTAGGYRNAAGASVVGQGGQESDGLTFFEREKARLIEEINGVSMSSPACIYTTTRPAE